MGTGETEEDVSHLFEQRTALLIGEDGVLEVRLLLVVYNLLDVGTLLPDSRFDGWQVVALLNLAEVRSTEWKTALCLKRILTVTARSLCER